MIRNSGRLSGLSLPKQSQASVFSVRRAGAHAALCAFVWETNNEEPLYCRGVRSELIHSSQTVPLTFNNQLRTLTLRVSFIEGRQWIHHLKLKRDGTQLYTEIALSRYAHESHDSNHSSHRHVVAVAAAVTPINTARRSNSNKLSRPMLRLLRVE